MDYLIRFIQTHETFRQPEIEAVAELNCIKFEWLAYSHDSPFAVIRFHGDNHEAAAKSLISRSILTFAIYELWGEGHDYDSLHTNIRGRTESLWEQYRHASFRFEVDSFHGSRSTNEQRDLMESLGYMGFQGPIRMTKAEHHFTIFEDYKLDAPKPHRLFFGRQVAESGRKAVAKYTLKKRKYISTTSMDAELSLVTANLALSAPGRLGYDPFMGTGSFPLACAHFGSAVFGSDMDGRSIRGKKGRTVRANFEQYGTSSLYLDGFTADVTNTPLRRSRFLDSMVCDPPYGVREGLKVLGSSKAHLQQEVLLADGTPAHLGAGYIPPKRPYSFVRMLDDILDFASELLVDGGRLCMWMPVAGAPDDGAAAEAGAELAEADQVEEAEYSIPQHPALLLVSSCRQDFNKWSRRLLTYKRLADASIDSDSMAIYRMQRLEYETHRSDGGATADELNDFRRKYFQGFKT
ncbi:related to TRM11 Catalytic subunit of an adoMet-dependent tRNA methyltransferase complex (Trm11p-Trm112p) [Lecanosticta acicola]|uniref:tRNA (guanine(10)-N(2))-methyltransferase n=1 Tax=Lecanosticta acicola TaxID=111012 RepID=A0AAI8Z6R7_9PEZI|nr:related to TRM11 Catalytic subunit of an adoMet-dependent tRNA methyltransferase complex (Trm11p-Trm112p) [Lecanosticta acicola]